MIERTDGRAKSLVFPKSVRDGFDRVLAKSRIPFTKGPFAGRGEALFVSLNGKEEIDRYVALLRSALRPGNWNEVVGARFLFVFDDGVTELDSVDADRKILARCQAIDPAVGSAQSVMAMLSGCEFYKDLLFHADWGTMRNSGEFSGTPGDRALDAVVGLA